MPIAPSTASTVTTHQIDTKSSSAPSVSSSSTATTVTSQKSSTSLPPPASVIDKREEVKKVEICPDCHSKNTIVTNMAKGNRVCAVCGIELEAGIIDETFEKRAFTTENGTTGHDNNRIGGPSNPLLEDLGLDTGVSSDPTLFKQTQRNNQSSMDKLLNRGFR